MFLVKSKREGRQGGVSWVRDHPFAVHRESDALGEVAIPERRVVKASSDLELVGDLKKGAPVSYYPREGSPSQALHRTRAQPDSFHLE